MLFSITLHPSLSTMLTFQSPSSRFLPIIAPRSVSLQVFYLISPILFLSLSPPNSKWESWKKKGKRFHWHPLFFHLLSLCCHQCLQFWTKRGDQTLKFAHASRHINTESRALSIKVTYIGNVGWMLKFWKVKPVASGGHALPLQRVKASLSRRWKHERVMSGRRLRD